MPGPGIPYIKWGLFYDEKGVAHVAPAIEEYLMKGHTLSKDCKCSPRIHKTRDAHMVIHYVIH